MTRDDVQRWLGRYIAAWASDDGRAIGELFTDDASYRFHPSDEGFVGRAAIVRSWLDPSGDASTGDEPGTWEARYEPFVVGGDRAVAVGWSRYYTDTSKTAIRSVYDNAYLLEFGEPTPLHADLEPHMFQAAKEPLEIGLPTSNWNA